MHGFATTPCKFYGSDVYAFSTNMPVVQEGVLLRSVADYDYNVGRHDNKKNYPCAA